MKFSSVFRNKIFLHLLISLISVLIAIILSYYFKADEKSEKLYSNFQNTVFEKQKNLDLILTKTSNIVKVKNPRTLFKLNPGEFLCNEGTLILVYENDTLKYWSDNYVPLPGIYSEELFRNEFQHFENGWFLVKQLKKENKRFIGLCLVKSDYKYQNEYLKNEFNDDFNLPSGTKIKLNEGDYNIYSSSDNFLFSLQFNISKQISDKKLFIIFLLYLLGFLFFISFLFNAHRSLGKSFRKRWIYVLTFVVDIIILRFIIVYFEIPNILFESDLFSPAYFAGAKYLPSLGHLFIDTILLVTISYVVCLHLKFSLEKLKNRLLEANILIVLVFFIILLLFKGLIFLFSSLIINSNISLDLNQILDFSAYSILSYFIIISLILSFFLLAIKLLDLVYRISFSINKYKITIIISLLIICLLDYLSAPDQPINTLMLGVFIVSYGLFIRYRQEFISFTTIVFYIFLFALFSTYILHENLQTKEHENRKLLAIELSTERDPVTEYLFKIIQEKTLNDSILQNYIIDAAYHEEAESKAIEYLQKKYFNDYWTKYNLQIIICHQDKLLDIEFENMIMNCNDYFGRKIREMGLPTSNPDLFYMDYGFGDDSYIGILEFSGNSEVSDTIVRAYIETVSKIVPKGLGYPELLIDRKFSVKNETASYSYAIYKNHELIKMVGDFSYSITDYDYGAAHTEFRFFNEAGYSHLLYRPGDNSSIIISKAESSFLDIIAPFSYLFIFYGIYILLFIVVIYFPYRNKKVELNFRNQLQFSIVSIVIASFLIIGISSLSYIKSLNNDKNYDILSEKAHSVLIELEHKLASEDQLTPEIHEYLSVLLIKFSNVFFSDINLYDLDGKLLASSRPQIFEEGLISDRMNNRAYEAMSLERKSNFIQKEKICNYEYLSAYVPFRNERNKLIAYLNLPYFAKQDELRQEITTFLVAFINIYVILIAISIFIALLVSNYISRPLKLIKEKISKLRLGKSNEKIDWERKDEIGNLIIEYNSMIDELAESARLLAKSERESAWREMAKQVAHEIKNPLTPMKLNVQHLQKAWQEKASDWEDRLNKFSNTLIEQIESLSKIASEFSDFANMPKTEAEKIELSEIIKSSIELHKNYENISIDFKTDKERPYYVFADKKQMLRVFNNLIKNSVQAIGRSNNGWIKISIKEDYDSYIIRVSDNGSGISKEQGDKIFIPSFTTKTSGMGLGLSMVKSIVLSAGGNITYSSEEGRGTTFYITLPRFEE